MLKNKNILKIKNLIVITVLTSIMLNTVSYAEINSSQMSSVISKLNNVDNTTVNTGNLDIEEVRLSYILKNDNWIAFYKNFIRELCGVRLSYYSESGTLLAKKYVLPNQFQGSSYEYARQTIYVDNTLILRDTVNKYRIDLSNFSFSDNIPCFIDKNEIASDSWNFEETEIKTKNSYVDVNFDKWRNCKNIKEWLEDRKNIQNLTNELGVNFEGSDNLEIWLQKAEVDCKSPGILIEPITFYPDSTEEIYCNNNNVCKKYNLTHGLTKSRIETEMKELGKWSWWDSLVHSVASFFSIDSLDIYVHIGILKMDFNDTLANNLTPSAQSLIEGNSEDFGTTSHEWDADAGYESINPGTMSARFFDRSFIGLTYTETTKYSRNWQKDFSIFGPTANMDEVEGEEIDYSNKYSINMFHGLTGPLENSIEKYGKLENDPNIKNENIEFYKEIGLINNKNEVMTYAEYEKYYENNEENIRKYVEKVRSEDQIVTATAFWWNFRSEQKEEMSLSEAKTKYLYDWGYLTGRISDRDIVSDDTVIDYFLSIGWEYNSSKKLFTKTEGRGDCYVKTDHNAFSCLVLKSNDSCLATTEESLVTAGALNSLSNDRIYKFGAALIIGPGKIATQSQILLKFNNNLEQIGGDSSIDEQYNTMVSIGEMFKASKTYPDEIAEDYKTSDGSAYTYTSYTAIPGKDGNSGSGRRFKIGKSREITEELLSYALDKQKDESGNEYSVVVLYVDWCYKDGDEGLSKSMILYEDELSNVYDFNSIDSTGNTRKLQGVINRGGKQHPVDGLGGCGGHTCSHKTDGTFDISIFHDFSGGDYNNCILDEQQTTVGDGTYTKSGQFVTGFPYIYVKSLTPQIPNLHNLALARVLYQVSFRVNLHKL